MIGASAVESLLFSRYGTESLPLLFVLLGPVTFIVLGAYGALLGKIGPPRTVPATMVLMALSALAARAVVSSPSQELFQGLWLAMMVMWGVQMVAQWGLANRMHDMRQAKRLFPLYSAAMILGSSVGGLSTSPLALTIGTENLLLVWSATLFYSAWMTKKLTGLVSGQVVVRAQRPRAISLLLEGIRVVRKSRLLIWMAAVQLMLAMLYFLVAFVFATAAAQRFPATDELSAFLGAFFGVSSAIAFMVSLGVANRLFAAVGISASVVGMALVYALGFLSFAVTMAFGVVAIVRLVQLVWYNGVWGPGWQAMYNVVLEEHRDRVRTLLEGGALQLGISLSGALLLFVGTRPSSIVMTGFILAGGALVSALFVRSAYPSAVRAALEAGNPDVFVPPGQSLAKFRHDASAMRTLLAGAMDDDASVARISWSLLSEIGTQEERVRSSGLTHPDPHIRSLALLASGRGGFLDVDALSSALTDDDSGVRAAALDVLLEDPKREVAAIRDRMSHLIDDEHLPVAAKAANYLLCLGSLEVLDTVERWASSEDKNRRLAAMVAIKDVVEADEMVAKGLTDPEDEVRRAAVLNGGARLTADQLIELLLDPDEETAWAAADMLSDKQTSSDELWKVVQTHYCLPALSALARIGHDRERLQLYARAEIERAGALARWTTGVSASAPANALLKRHLEGLKRQATARAITAMVHDRVLVAEIVDGLASSNKVHRATAIETLESALERHLARPLVSAWEDQPPVMDEVDALRQLSVHEDGWIAALANICLQEGEPMRAAPGLNRVERVLMLSSVPLFANLSPADLHSIAEVTVENSYPDGSYIARQGEGGDEMHIIVSGHVHVLVAGKDGTEVQAGVRGPGEHVGEMAIISGSPRMASLRCEGQVRTISIDRTRFQRIVRDRIETGFAVMRALCDRVQEAYGI
ncbi:MAG: cyclic nucleotide-binding domain-containing protein [Actinobacteria bacterium]|nr:cyclic nucleotide-binding domain-containing protein [Actinomycetota bacterium]